MLRRAAVSAKVAASRAGHSELSIAISEEKNVYEMGVKLIAAKTDASVYSYKWARGETNKAIQDVFLKICGLTSVWAEAQNEFAHKYKEYRGALKEVLHEEKSIGEMRKQQNTCASRLTKLKKQVDIARRKNDTAKLEALVPDLQQAIIANDKAYEELEQKMDHVEAFKATRIRQSLVLLSQAYLTLADKMTTIFTAQKQLAELITSETVPNSNMPPDPLVYEACSKKSHQILETTCKSLNFPIPQLPGEPQTSLRMYRRRDSPVWSDSAPPSPSPYSRKVPLPLPQKATGATSLDKVLSASAEDIRPRLSPRPEQCKPEYVEPDDIVPGRNAKRSGRDVRPTKQKSVSDSHFQLKGTGHVRNKSDEYSQVQDMYEWVWQRQAEILSGDSGDYSQPFDLIPGRNVNNSDGVPAKVVQRRNTTGNILEEDSLGYLVPLGVIDRDRAKPEDTHSSPEDDVGVQKSDQEDDCTNSVPVDSGEYSYARVVTTSARPYSKPISSAVQKIAPRPQSPRPYSPKLQSPKPQSPKLLRRPEPLPKPK